MKLKYRILWFDDNENFFDSLDLDSLKMSIASWGFVPDFSFVTTSQEFYLKAPYSEYDLLLVDYHLEGIGEGQDFIRSVREHEVFTEVIFYSSNSTEDLWKEIRDHKLEGIFVANRLNVIERILSVGHQSLRKVLDVDNMRGIVMAEVGDLDLAIGRVLLAGIAQLNDDQRSTLFDKFYISCKEFNEKGANALEDFKLNPSAGSLVALCDSNKLWQNFNRVRRDVGALSIVKFGDYVNEVLSPRNHLAHGAASPLPCGSMMFTHRNKQYIFSETIGVALRHKIIEYKGGFSAIETAIGAITERLDSA